MLFLSTFSRLAFLLNLFGDFFWFADALLAIFVSHSLDVDLDVANDHEITVLVASLDLVFRSSLHAFLSCICSWPVTIVQWRFHLHR